MAIKSLQAYITVDNGRALEAIALYERVLGAQRVKVTLAGDVPGMNPPPDQRQRVIHSVLQLGGTLLMISDDTETVPSGGHVQLALDFTDLTEMTDAFATLARDGKVILPVQDTFWGAKFGMLLDPFGVRWMFNCPTPVAVPA
jgi:PhnB protein